MKCNSIKALINIIMPRLLLDKKRDVKLLCRNIYETICYYPSRSKNLPISIRRIVFVCKGNICRSAFAEQLMRAKFRERAVSIESCGLNATTSSPAPFEAIRVAKKFGMNMENHQSRGWDSCDLDSADLIIAMEYWHYTRLIELFPDKKECIKLIRDYAPFPENVLCNINDPYGQNEIVFERCFMQIQRCLTGIITKYIE